jgi:hypothetical protein
MRESQLEEGLRVFCNVPTMTKTMMTTMTMITTPTVRLLLLREADTKKFQNGF